MPLIETSVAASYFVDFESAENEIAAPVYVNTKILDPTYVVIGYQLLMAPGVLPGRIGEQ